MKTIIIAAGMGLRLSPLTDDKPKCFMDKQIVATSTGFIDGMGYIGTVSIGIIVPFLVTSTAGRWANVFIFWAILSSIVAIFVAIVYIRSFKDKTLDFLALNKKG